MWRVLLLAGVVTCSSDWGYEKETGPHVWSKQYPDCEEYSQSPVVLPTVFADHPFLQTIEYHNFKMWGVEITQDGKSIVILVKDSGKGKPYITGAMFKTKQYLHKIEIKVGTDGRGSEHGMDGMLYDGELLYYYYDKKYKSYEEALKIPGGVSILSSLLKEQKENNAGFDTIISHLDEISNSTNGVPDIMEGELNAPVYDEEKECTNCDYYFYEGSLSAPPCSEVAYRFVYAYPLPIGEMQLEKFKGVLSYETGKPMVNNNRYPQPLNMRMVFQHHERDAKYYKLPDPAEMHAPPLPPPGHRNMMQPNMQNMPNMPNMQNMPNRPNMHNMRGMPHRMPQPGTNSFQPQYSGAKPSKIKYGPRNSQLT